jgi:hypothetical protein
MSNLALRHNLDTLLESIARDYPDLKFIESAHFAWHSGRKHVAFKRDPENVERNMWALLHELGHALLNHSAYVHDVELVQLEVAAWERARSLAKHYGLQVDEDYVEDCLDTYRDWLHLRSTCPTCYGRALQASERLYRCFNCQGEWQVSRSRLCRPYRLQTTPTA